MRASRKIRVIPLLLAAAIATAVPATIAVGAATHVSGSIAACPDGTNWDAATGTCQ